MQRNEDMVRRRSIALEARSKEKTQNSRRGLVPCLLSPINTATAAPHFKRLNSLALCQIDASFGSPNILKWICGAAATSQFQLLGRSVEARNGFQLKSKACLSVALPQVETVLRGTLVYEMAHWLFNLVSKKTLNSNVVKIYEI